MSSSKGSFYPTVNSASDTSVGAPEKAAKQTNAAPPLFTPIKFRDVVLKNRFVVSPMCMYSCDDGFLNNYHLVHLGAFALRGAALTIVEATAVSPEGRISPADSGLWKKEHIASHKRVVEFIQSTGGKAGIQLAHAGRKASTYPPWQDSVTRSVVPKGEGGWPDAVVGPSGTSYPGLSEVRQMTIEEIKALVQKFVDSAKYADEAGYDVIELHSAHGYALHSFLSPKSNSRNDEYGGSFENRTRLLLEIFHAVRDVWPAGKPLFVRISGTDWLQDGEGWDIDQSIRLARLLKEAGADLIDCSSGGLDPGQRINAGPGFQVPFAERIKKEVNIPTGAVGLIFTAKLADEIVKEGKADLVFVAREFLRDPAFVLRSAHELGVNVAWPRQYERAKREKL